jgi:D-alanyl-D-alanine carboxypeptidase/D-alanyl-D-alanine-endopeptidase (penicillin-binding protein 4)
MGRQGAAWALAALLAGGLGAAAAEPPYQALAERLVGRDQGVYLRAEDGTVLAAVAEARPVHPASVSKIPTTLALLRHFGPDHRFVTRLAIVGRVEDGRLDGTLVVQASGDPTLVAEHAVAMAARLRSRGIRRVTEGLRVDGPLIFDWHLDPAGAAFRRALAGAVGPAVVRRAAMLDPTAGPGLVLTGTPSAAAAEATPVVEHRSATLLEIVKALNSYSNNVFHALADQVGGVGVVESVARSVVPAAWASEIHLDNGAGAGTTNRLSPRATVAIVDALERTLVAQGLDLTDVLPVAGRDVGTLEDRLDRPPVVGAVVGKTGTYGSLGASALAGVVRTERWGRVTFAILNRDVPVPEARRRQDALVRALVADAGSVPFPYRPPRRSVVLATEVRSIGH